MTHSVKTWLCKIPSPILHCISQLGKNKGGKGHWVSQNYESKWSGYYKPYNKIYEYIPRQKRTNIILIMVGCAFHKFPQVRVNFYILNFYPIHKCTYHLNHYLFTLEPLFFLRQLFWQFFLFFHEEEEKEEYLFASVYMNKQFCD